MFEEIMFAFRDNAMAISWDRPVEAIIDRRNMLREMKEHFESYKLSRLGEIEAQLGELGVDIANNEMSEIDEERQRLVKGFDELSHAIDDDYNQMSMESWHADFKATYDEKVANLGAWGEHIMHRICSEFATKISLAQATARRRINNLPGEVGDLDRENATRTITTELRRTESDIKREELDAKTQFLKFLMGESMALAHNCPIASQLTTFAVENDAPSDIAIAASDVEEIEDDKCENEELEPVIEE